MAHLRLGTIVVVALIVLVALASATRADDTRPQGAVVVIPEDADTQQQQQQQQQQRQPPDGVVAETSESAAPADPEDGVWRELEPEEGVPRGSHVQMNLATGKKYVKEPKPGAAGGAPGAAVAATSEECEDEASKEDDAAAATQSAKYATMERVLYGLPTPDPRLPDAESKKRLTPEEYQALLDQVWARRQQEIKKAMESMDDYGQIVQNLTQVLLNSTLEHESPELLDALDDLEHMVQDIDHAMHFTSLGGIDLCVHLLRHNSARVRERAAFTAGSAIKNHADMQGHALKAGLLARAMDRLEHLLPCAGARGEPAPRECAKLLYALSASVRGFPAAQQEAKTAGLAGLLLRLAELPDLEEKVAVKVLALISDTIVEWQGVSLDWHEDHNQTGVKLCDALLSRAAALVAGGQVDSDGATSDPSHQQLVEKLTSAVEDAGCDLSGGSVTPFLLSKK